MSDARGLATGGVSTIMQVALGGDADACDVRPDAVDARFSLYPQSRTVQQCSKRTSLAPRPAAHLLAV